MIISLERQLLKSDSHILTELRFRNQTFRNGNHLFRIDMTNYKMLLILVLMSFPKSESEEESVKPAQSINIYLFEHFNQSSLTPLALNFPPECRYEVNL